MSYIGKVDMNDANIKHYSLTGSTATTVDIGWVPPSEQSLRVTINGVVQQGGTFSLSGSNLTLGGALVATDDLEVVGIQSVGNLITPADNSVTTAKLTDDAVTTAKILDNNVTLAKMAGLARGKIIVGDASGDPSALALGASTYLLTSDGSDAAWAAPPAGGLSQYSVWLMDTTFTGSADPMTNWTEASLGYERIGTVMGESSGVFTFPETGKWEIHLFANGSGAAWPTSTGNSYHIAYSTNSGVSFSDLSKAERWGYGGAYEQSSSASMVFFDVTNISTHQIRFRAYARTGTNITGGSSTGCVTYAVFKKIGAT